MAAGPSFCWIEMYVCNDHVIYTFIYNRVRFCIRISTENLEGCGNLLAQFRHFKEGVNNGGRWGGFEDWILNPLEDAKTKLAPTPATRKPITLIEYYAPAKFAFALFNKQINLSAVQEDYKPEIHRDLGPRSRILDIPRDSKPNPAFAQLPIDYLIRASIPQVPFIPASELETVDDGVAFYRLSHTPKKVRRRGSNETFFFKPVSFHHGEVREIDMLDRISASGKFNAPYLTSKLIGLVVWDSSNTWLMGLLLEYIKGDTLQSRMEEASIAALERWIDQVEATVRQLHEFGLVWGDAKVDNIIINENGVAVVVDFGGGYLPDHLPREFKETEKGDWMCLEHIRKNITEN